MVPFPGIDPPGGDNDSQLPPSSVKTLDAYVSDWGVRLLTTISCAAGLRASDTSIRPVGVTTGGDPRCAAPGTVTAIDTDCGEFAAPALDIRMEP
jgi:hypothetical protein